MAYSNDHPDWVVTTALNAFQNVGAWIQGQTLGATLVGARGSASTAWLFIAGGLWAGAETSLIFVAALNPDSSLGAWVHNDNLPISLQLGDLVIYNGYFYYIGGSSGGIEKNTVYYAKINANGTLGAFATTAALPVTMSKLRAVAYNGYMYAVAGSQNGVNGAAVYKAQINPDGTLGAWVATTSLPVTRISGQLVQANGYLYYIGGYGALQAGGSGYVNTVYYAKINADGTIGNWTAGIGYPTPVSNACIMFDNQYIYIIGGISASGASAAVYAAGVNSDGSIGPWISTTALPVTSVDSASAYVYEQLYIIAGTLNGAASGTMYSASV